MNLNLKAEEKPAAEDLGCQSLGPGLGSTYSSLTDLDLTPITAYDDGGLLSLDKGMNPGLFVSPDEPNSKGTIGDMVTAPIFEQAQSGLDDVSLFIGDDQHLPSEEATGANIGLSGDEILFDDLNTFNDDGLIADLN